MQIIFIPFMDRKALAERIGVSPAVVEKWIRDGRLSTVSMGKRQLVDLRTWVKDVDDGSSH